MPSQVRLRLKPPVASSTGFVDGAWWPRSRNLSAELPALLAALRPRLGRVERVTYNLSVWDLAVRKAAVGHQVRLDGSFSQAPDLVAVAGAGGRRLTLLVVPPDTAEVAAHRVLIMASRPDNVDGTDVLLTARPVAVGGESGDEPDMVAERWEGDGGRRYEHA
ncbi:DUF5994 family protein [Amycolatopsis cihanbeyliensis]|nr:DUF5994 family protein [Amycolatopsis cihanbeyliensis]